jgi:predicted transporter
MERLHPITVGSATAITLAIVNVACALIVWLWPEAAFGIFGSFAHGLDFRAVRSAEPLELGRFLVGLMSIAAIGFVLGAIYAWVYNALRRV